MIMPRQRTRARKISPSDEELEKEILAILQSEEADSTASAIGLYASYNRIKESKKDWMLSPIRLSTRYEAMVRNGRVRKISDDDPRYFKPRKTAREQG